MPAAALAAQSVCRLLLPSCHAPTRVPPPQTAAAAVWRQQSCLRRLRRLQARPIQPSKCTGCHQALSLQLLLGFHPGQPQPHLPTPHLPVWTCHWGGEGCRDAQRGPSGGAGGLGAAAGGGAVAVCSRCGAAGRLAAHPAPTGGQPPTLCERHHSMILSDLAVLHAWPATSIAQLSCPCNEPALADQL